LRQSYISDELIHCVGRALGSDEDRYTLLLEIINGQILKRPPRDGFVGMRMQMYSDICSDELIDSQIVCFCDIPLPELSIHVTKYSRFGLAFPKAFLVRQGANPVYYVARDSVVPANVWPRSEPVIRSEHHRDPYSARPEAPDPVTRCAYFNEAARLYNSEYTYRYAITAQAEKQGNDFLRVDDLNKFLTFQFLAFVKFFDPTLPEDDLDNYYMEREWRVLGDVTFKLDDIARVVVPPGYEERLKADLPAYGGEVSSV